MDRLVIDPAPEDVLEALPADASPLPADVVQLLLPGGEHKEVELVEGLTLREVMDGALPADMHEFVRAFHHGTEVLDWDGFTLRRGDRLILAVVPQGGGRGGNKKGIIGAILTIAIAVVAPYAAAAIYTAAGGTFVSASAGLYITAIQAGITLVGAMAVSALIKPPAVSTAIADRVTGSAKSYSLTGQSNAPRPFGACLVVYGRHKVMPALAANPDVDNWGQSSVLTALYDFGLGWVQLDDLRIGDVSAWEYAPEIVVHTNSLCRDLRMVTARIGYDQYAVTLKQNDPLVVRTKIDSFFANLDIQFPKGIFQTNAQGSILPMSVDLAAFWRKAGDPNWQQAPLDWFHGAQQRYYTSGAALSIQFRTWFNGEWEDYNPVSSPGRLRELVLQVQQTPERTAANLEYVMASENLTIQFTYPSGDMDEASYMARYPEVAAAGWARGARAHFESVGAREGRDPLVPVFIKGRYSAIYDQGWYNTTTMPSKLHAFDKSIYGGSDPQYYDRFVGGWAWIDSSAAIPPINPNMRLPLEWRVKEGWPPFDGALYYARYPDVAASGINAWVHFTNNGAYEGRDPYTWAVQTAVRMVAQAVGPYWMRVAFAFPSPGDYELQIMRTDPSYDGSAGGSTQKVNEAIVGLLRSYQYGEVVSPRLKHTMMEMRVQASEQLQGVVQNLSAIAHSVLRVAWYDANNALQFGYAATRNPAWIALDMLTSEKNPRPLRDDQIDWYSWIYLSWKCDTVRSWVVNGQPFSGPRYTCDIVLEDFSTVLELVESVLSGCRSSLILTKAGTWGVLHDEEKSTPRQLITPGNSWNFSGARTFSQVPHALRVGFINRDNAWQRDEVVVYNDGYWADNATIFETLDTFGITDYPHAWAYGRFMLAQGIQRAELFTVTMDVENLLVQRGDMVHVAHDVPRIGGMPLRIVTVQDPAAGQAIKVNMPLTFAPTGYAWRGANGTMRTGAVYTNDSYPSDTIVVDSTAGMAPDDLIVLGEYDRTVQPYLVQRIVPGSDLTAELTLCKYVPAVYDADIGAIPPWDPGFGHDYLNGTDLVDFNAIASSRLYYIEREPRTDVLLQWQTRGWALDHHEVVLIFPSGQREVISSDVRALSFQWTIDAIRSLKYYDIPLRFEITPVSTVGFRGVATTVTITIHPDRSAPPLVQQFGANVQKETIDLFWQPPDAPDIDYYLLRYTPETQVPNWEASQFLARISYPSTKTSVGARTGSYGIRVFDTSGNMSDVVWRRTTVAVLPEINVVEVVNDLHNVPPWDGKRDHVVIDGNELMSEGAFGSVYPMGIYYMAEPVDLGEVFEFRVSSKIQAYGVTRGDFMDQWPVLSQLPSMSSSQSIADLWDCWLEVRTSDASMMMSDWVPSIAELTSMAAGAESGWSGWRPCLVGDFTGQLIQMRIVMQSKSTDVKVAVKSGRVEIDMPDRIDTFGDIAVSAAGLDFVFPVAFRVLQSVAITIDGNADPVVAKVTNKSNIGLRVQLINTLNGAATAGQVDIQAEGYGRMRAQSI